MISRRRILSTVPHPLSRTAPSSAAASKAREARRPWMTLSASEANIEKRLFDCSQMRVSGEKKTEKTKGQRRAAPGAPSLLSFWKEQANLFSFPHRALSRSLCLFSTSFILTSDGPFLPRRPRQAGKGAVVLAFLVFLVFDRHARNCHQMCRGRGRPRRPLGDARVRASLRRLCHLPGAGENGRRRRGEKEKDT